MAARVPHSYGSTFHLQTPADIRDTLVFKIRQNEVLNDFAKLRDDYYEKYVENLEKRVQAQRKALAKARVFSTVEEQTVKKFKRRKEVKLKYHTLKHDKKFLQNVPKSHYYHLLAVEKLMKERGLLKTREEIDKFWATVRKDSKLWNTEMPTHIDPDKVTELMAKKYSPVRSKNSCHVHYHVKLKTPVENDQGKFTNSTEELNLSNHPLYQEIKLPKLHALRKSPIVPTCIGVPLDEDPEPPIEKIHPKLFKHRRKVEAYNISRVNQAFTGRLVMSHNLIDLHKVPNLHDDFKIELPKQGTSKPKKIKNAKEKGQVFITEPVFGTDMVLIPDLEYKYAPDTNFMPNQNFSMQPITEQNEPADQRRHNEPANQRVHPEPAAQRVHTKTPIATLSYNMMFEKESNANIKEAKVLSTLWKNYA